MEEKRNQPKLHHHAVQLVKRPTVKHIYVYLFFLVGFIIFGVGFIVILNSFHQKEKEISLPIPTGIPVVTPLPTKPIIAVPTPGVTQKFGLMCGGIAGKLCPQGFRCKIKNPYPDASGTCVQSVKRDTDVSQQKLDYAVNDLAKRLNVDISSITVVSAQRKTWNDGSLGCPKPGMMYTQSIVEGYEITLSHAGTLYSYHGGSANPSLCLQ